MHVSKEEMPKFIRWLDNQGAQVVPTTNPYELLRFKTVNGVSVLYRNKFDVQTFTGECEVAYRHFRDKKRWATHDRHRKQMTSLKTKLANRDGLKCFWCDTPHKSVETLTVEHILNRMHGGSDNSRNLSLACKDCNDELSNLPVVSKILLREKKLNMVKMPVLSKEVVTIQETPKGPNMFQRLFKGDKS
jgi:hypothetical protein